MNFFQALLSKLTLLFVGTIVALQMLIGGTHTIVPTVGTSSLATSSPITATSSSQTTVASTSTSSTPIKKPVSLAPVATKSSTPAQTTPVSASGAGPTTYIDPDTLNTETRAALVNILCEVSSGGTLHSISGSGVFIDSRGVILTNAHIGQYFLLKDYPSPNSVDCMIRPGSPAQPMYRATLLYLPPAWMQANASQINAEHAVGTGENDYAFLLVTSSTGPNPLPSSFPNLAMTSDEPTIGESMFLTAYPAGFLDSNNILRDLYASSAYAVVQQLFTFNSENNVDLVSVGGTIVSQGGSSGGAVVRTTDGKLQGLIATATTADTTAARDLRAITLAHIERSLIAGGQGGIEGLLSQDLTKAAANFAANVAPAEKAALVSAIEHH